MTEDDAKTKWCPMVRISVDADGLEATNRGDPCNEVHCLGSQCMAWQWLNNMGNLLRPSERHENNNGYCGLTGKS